MYVQNWTVTLLFLKWNKNTAPQVALNCIQRAHQQGAKRHNTNSWCQLEHLTVKLLLPVGCSTIGYRSQEGNVCIVWLSLTYAHCLPVTKAAVSAVGIQTFRRTHPHTSFSKTPCWSTSKWYSLFMNHFWHIVIGDFVSLEEASK